jgi:GAF domain-containing protein
MCRPATGRNGTADIAGGQDGRLTAVQRYEVLDAPEDSTFDRIAELAATVVDTPIATVAVVADDRVWFAAGHGLGGLRQVGVEPGLWTTAVSHDGLYVVPDTTTDPDAVDHPLVRGEPGVRFYAAAPIVTADGHRVGSVGVIDTAPRTITDRQRAALTTLADLALGHLDLRLAERDAARAEHALRAEAERRAADNAVLAAQLHRAAALQHANSHPSTCQLGGSRRRCDRPAEVKVADPWGDSAWGCAAHVEEAVRNLPSVFLADDRRAGLATYLQRH